MPLPERHTPMLSRTFGALLLLGFLLTMGLPVGTPSAAPAAHASVTSWDRSLPDSNVHPSLVPIGWGTSSNLSVQDLSPLLPSVAGGSWSEVDALPNLAGSQFAVFGTDHATGLPKLGALSNTSAIPAFKDTSQPFFATLNQSSETMLSGQLFGTGVLQTPQTIQYLWNAQFRWSQNPPAVWKVNVSGGTDAALAPPPGMDMLSGGTSDGSSLLFVGENLSGSVPYPIYEVFNETGNYTNVSSAVPAGFGVASAAFGTASGFLLTANTSGNTLGVLSYVSGTGWVFKNMTASLPPLSSFSSPVLPVASHGPLVLLQSYATGAIFTPKAWGVVNLTSGAFSNDTAAVLAQVSAPTAFGADPRAPANFTLASSVGIEDLNGNTGAASSLSAIPLWNYSLTPLCLAWTPGNTLLVGGTSSMGWGFLRSWTGTGTPSPVPLPTGFVSASTLASLGTEVFLGGTNGSSGAAALLNLSTSSLTDLSPHLPTNVGPVLSSAFVGPTAYFTDGTNIYSYDTATSGPLGVIPSPGFSPILALASVNGSLWAGGQLSPLGGAALFSFSPAAGNWTNLSAGVTTLGLEIQDVVPGAPGTALLSGTSSAGAQALWYYNGTSSKPFQNVTGDFGTLSQLLFPGQIAWSGSAFWVLNGTQVLAWDPASGLLQPIPLSFPVPTATLTSLAVLGSFISLNGIGTESVNATYVPVSFTGVNSSSPLVDLTPAAGSHWRQPPISLVLPGSEVAAAEQVNGTLSLSSVLPPLNGVLSANRSEADAPAAISFSLQVSGGEAPYGTIQWNATNQTGRSGASASFTFSQAATVAVNATVRDAAGSQLFVQGVVVINPPLVISVQATPPSGPAPLSVSINWSASGGAGFGYHVTLAFGDSQLATGLNGTGTLSHSYAAPGNFTLTATVSDGYASVISSTSVTVTPGTPTTPTLLGVSVSPPTGKVQTGGVLDLNATPSCTSPCTAGAVSYRWSLSAPLGTLSSTTGSSVRFTAGASPGNTTLYVNATLGNVTKEATVALEVLPGGGGGGSGSTGGSGVSAAVIAVIIILVVIVAVVGLFVYLRRRNPLGPPRRSSPGSRPPR